MSVAEQRLLLVRAYLPPAFLQQQRGACPEARSLDVMSPLLDQRLILLISFRLTWVCRTVLFTSPAKIRQSSSIDIIRRRYIFLRESAPGLPNSIARRQRRHLEVSVSRVQSAACSVQRAVCSVGPTMAASPHTNSVHDALMIKWGSLIYTYISHAESSEWGALWSCHIAVLACCVVAKVTSRRLILTAASDGLPLERGTRPMSNCQRIPPFATPRVTL